METKPKIAVIHPNSLCCMAMRTIITDIAPFIGAFRAVETATYNSMDEFLADEQCQAIHYFVAVEVVIRNLPFFAPQYRRCIVLTEGNTPTELPSEFRTVDIRQPERELLKGFLAMQGTAHAAHGMAPRPAPDYAELLSQREKDVLALIVKGYINKEIADMLNISTATVIFHRRNIAEKLGTKSIGRLTIYAVMNGIVGMNEL